MKRIHRHRVLTPELREKVGRLIELNEAHMAAIQDKPGAETFYTDGRFDEMGEIGPVVRQALGIRPGDDDMAMLRGALEDAAKK